MRPEARPHLTLVIPVYNGARFLAGSLRKALDWLEQQPFASELLVVDDGSSDATAEILARFAAEQDGRRCSVTTLRNASNRGKGFSVRRAFLHAAGQHVIFTDADLTYPVDNFEPLLRALEDGADFAYGSRMHPDSRYVVAPSFFGKLFTRHVMGRTFNLLLRTILAPGVMDSQAGLKGCRQAAARELAQLVTLPRFSFDVEMFFVARRLGYRLAECPVHFIYCKEPSTVHFVRDSLAMVRDILRVRWRGLRGRYERRPPSAAALLDLRDGGAAVTAPRQAAKLQKSG